MGAAITLLMRNDLLLQRVFSLGSTIALTLIDGVDEGGYLRGELEEVADRLGCGLERIEAVLSVCHGFEPTGIMARSRADRSPPPSWSG